MAASWSQKAQYPIAAIPVNLKENADAIVRYEHTEINVSSRSAVQIKTIRVVTVFNEGGLDNIGAYESRHVKTVGATIYDVNGTELKKLKRKDFKEVAVSEGSIISDAKMTYLDFTPTQYPFTIAYESEVGDGNTGFLPPWFPLHSAGESVEKSIVTVTCPAGLGLRFQENNLAGYPIAKEEKANGFRFTAENLMALKAEQYSPSFRKLFPHVKFAIEKFSLEGVEGEATSWRDFGNWMQNSLIAGTTVLPPEAKAQILERVGGETDPMKKARIVYQYVQDRTRYVSIQLGIGGWRPMKVADVHRLGYGDCKALTNYTKALLETVGVPSYYAIIHADREKVDLDPDFVSLQGNHATLAIPDGNQLRWVECTSQTAPFDFQANSTDDRLALVLKPEGGELVRTKVYRENDNSQISTAQLAIDPSGQLSANIEIKTRGTQYGSRVGIERKAGTARHDHYKDYFSQINNLKLEKIEIDNNKALAEFTEKISVRADGYAATNGNRLMFAANAFNQYAGVPQRYRNRSNGFEIDRGFYDQDEFTIAIPEGFTIEAKPDDVEINDAYGSYKAEYKITDSKHIHYKRSLLIKQGSYPAADYEKFRKFREQIARADNAKCVLIKT